MNYLVSDSRNCRSIGEIFVELDGIEAEAQETDKAFRGILKQRGI